ncbi:unnamed protein product, partial [Hapterophycus canaliculatus]
GEGAHGSVLEVEEIQQQGGRKIPGNPPFEIDDDEDEQENDMSHPEGFLRAMPEDESLMRVLQLPDGRVQRREEEDEEEEEKAAGVAAAAAEAAEAAAAAAAAAAANGDPPAADTETAVVVKAPSSAQAPPLTSSSHAPSASAEVLAAAAAAAPAMQAPRPPTADPAVFYSAGGRHKPNVSVDAALRRGVVPGKMFPGVGRGENAPAPTHTAAAAAAASAAASASLLSDPGLCVGPAVSLQRARSFSPRERVPEASLHSVASMPPMVPAPTMPAPIAPVASPPVMPAPSVPAPSFPAPRPPSGNVQFMEKHLARAEGVQPPDVLGTGNGPGSAGHLPSPHRGMGEGEKAHVSTQQSDQELQELLSGRANGGAGRSQTEIKIANLQGPEQEIMRLVMHTHIEGRLQEVEFDFNLDQDHPEQVRRQKMED